MTNSESLLQQTTVRMIREFYPTLVLNLSLNGISLNGLSVTQRAQLIHQAKLEGMETGIQDLTIYLPEGQVLNLEFKRPKGGAQSPDQKDIESKLKQLGHTYYLVRTPDEVFDLIAKYTTTVFRKTQFDQALLRFANGIDNPIILHFSKFGEGINVNQVLTKLYNL